MRQSLSECAHSMGLVDWSCFAVLGNVFGPVRIQSARFIPAFIFEVFFRGEVGLNTPGFVARVGVHV